LGGGGLGLGLALGGLGWLEMIGSGLGYGLGGEKPGLGKATGGEEEEEE
jgi:hypothetical protein